MSERHFPGCKVYGCEATDCKAWNKQIAQLERWCLTPWYRRPEFWRGFRKGASSPALMIATVIVLAVLAWRWL